ncbi:MAG TPA: DHA2 family efflux MFS transporter permease subunit [Candidatus Dormibacteraeota bacterium]|nr:DHA2 family efflux MFS transporter permease subunit [Candidatus Dormibacteraeota bacterium]
MPPRSSPDESVKRLLPWLVAVAFFMEALDTTILNTAVPTVAAALRVVPLSMKSVLASYTLSLAVFIPVSGWVADRYGTRRVFSAAIALFTVGSFLCGISTNIHALVACRILQGLGGAMMVPVGRLTIVRTFARSELVRAMAFVAIPGLIGPLLGPLAGGLIVGYLHWRMVFFVNLPIGLLGLYLVHRHLPDYRTKSTDRLDLIGLILFGSGIGLLSYVLEIFGEHSLGGREMIWLLSLSIVLLLGYGRHATTTERPLLRLDLFRIRTFRSAVIGSFITRLGAGGTPFLLPLLYQVGLGFTPVQSGLLIMPQSLAAMSLKMTMPLILTRFGYRRVLLSNTMLLGLLIGLFATIGFGTPVWLIVVQAFCFGFIASLQYTSMNTLVYADVTEGQTSMASTIASTLQQMSMSFGVAMASLATALFIPDRLHTGPAQMIHGVQKAFVLLGILTILSAAVFRELRPTDGKNVSRHEEPLPEG